MQQGRGHVNTPSGDEIDHHDTWERVCQAMQGRAVWAGAWNSWHHNQAFYYGLRSIPIAQCGTALP